MTTHSMHLYYGGNRAPLLHRTPMTQEEIDSFIQEGKKFGGVWITNEHWRKAHDAGRTQGSLEGEDFFIPWNKVSTIVRKGVEI